VLGVAAKKVVLIEIEVDVLAVAVAVDREAGDVVPIYRSQVTREPSGLAIMSPQERPGACWGFELPCAQWILSERPALVAVSEPVDLQTHKTML
jgi:hypothetical protein